MQSSYTAGYMGAFIMGAAVGAIIASGSGYYYPPYIGYPPCGYPIYRPYPRRMEPTALPITNGERRLWRIPNCLWSIRLGHAHRII